ncbi:ABC transporter permease [Colidextribacter sp. OB.20]|uniref:ABC transporter permease n=1 Tax=Colidextribacter sp. OB.20 TaxID=2304568 RepID=UPI001FAB85DB|nr:ABC transporter permease [Colidextribacter sp. OB.20]
MTELSMQKRRSSRRREFWLRLCRNKAALIGMVILSVLIITAVFAPIIAPYHYDEQNYQITNQLPSLAHPLGTDNCGRDILSRLIYGSRVSLQIGFIAVGIGAAVGGLLGAVAAFYGKAVDNIIMRCIDIVLAIPSTLLAISISAALGPGLTNAMIAIGIGSAPNYARIVRASVLTVKEQEFVEAARCVGASDAYIILREILPNALSPIIVQATLGVASAILSAAALSFIGLGIQPPSPEWGAMLSAGRVYIRDFWPIVTFPGVAIMITIFALNLFGDGLRDVLDPKLRR